MKAFLALEILAVAVLLSDMILMVSTAEVQGEVWVMGVQVSVCRERELARS